VNWPEHHNAFNNLESDDVGRIFVQTYEKAIDDGGFYYDVFDPEGRYLTHIPLKSAPKAIRKNNLYVIEEDKDGYQHVKRYKINWEDLSQPRRKHLNHP